MKLLVETSGSFMLMLPKGEIPAERPAVTVDSWFLQTRMSVGQVKLLGKLNDEATDAEFETYFAESKGDAELAVEAFLSAFGLSEMTAKGTAAAKDPALTPLNDVAPPPFPPPLEPVETTEPFEPRIDLDPPSE